MSIQVIIGLLLVVAFVGFVVYAIRGGNLMVGMITMAAVWTALAIFGNYAITDQAFIAQYSDQFSQSVVEIVTKVFQGGPEGWGSVLVNFIFGAWFGRIILETGIASGIITKTVELGGDKPKFTATLLLLVTSLIFTSMFGTGAVVAIGVIVLPIMSTLGINNIASIISFNLAVGAGLFINPVIFTQYQAFFLDNAGNNTVFYDSSYLTFGFIAMGIQMVVAIGALYFHTRNDKRGYRWSASNVGGGSGAIQAPREPNGLSLIAPLIPVILAIFFNIPVILGFLIAGLFALGLNGQMSSIKKFSDVMNKTFYDGVVDTAPLVGFLLTVPMFSVSANYAVPYFSALLGGIIPQSTLLVALAVAVLAPFALFRGPLTLGGSGAATLGILRSIGFSSSFLFPLMYAPTISMHISSDITQSWIVWGLNYNDVEPTKFLRKSVFTGMLMVGILSILTYVMYG